MPTRIRHDGEFAIEQSSYLIAATFYDEDDQPVVPNSATWSLTDTNGAPINGKTEEVITPAATVYIVLSGDDLALPTGFIGESVLRVVTVEAVYNSALGAGLKLKDQLTFPVMNLAKIDTP